MLAPLFKTLEARRHIEYLLAVLNRNDAPRGKTFAVARRIDLINNRRVGVTRAQEIAMEAVAEHILYRITSGH